jgi:hypothetical protein
MGSGIWPREGWLLAASTLDGSYDWGRGSGCNSSIDFFDSLWAIDTYYVIVSNIISSSWYEAPIDQNIN